MFLITMMLDLAYVQNYMRCLSQNKSDTKLFIVYLFTVFIIKRPKGASEASEDSDKYTLTKQYKPMKVIIKLLILTMI